VTPTLAMLLASSAAAAPPPEATWFRAGLTAPYGVQPGLSAVATHDITTWEGRRRDAAFSVGPRVAGFGRFENHLSGVVGAEASVRWTSPDTGRFVSLDGGLGYMLSAQVHTVSVDLGSGDLDRSRELQHHFLPTLGVHFGRTQDRVGWYGGVLAGRHISPQTPDSLWMSVEAGVRFGGAR